MRTITAIDTDWFYTPNFRTAYADGKAAPDGSWVPVTLPHTNHELPLNDFDETDSLFVSTYARKLEVPSGPGNRRFFLDFDGVMCACEVWVNGLPAGGHVGGFTPFSLEITGLIQGGAGATVVVKVDSTERADVPPFGHVVDYLCFGGIYRDVYFRTQDEAYITSVFARPGNILETVKSLAMDIEYDDGTASRRPTALSCALSDGGRIVGAATVTLPAGEISARGAGALPARVTVNLESLTGLRLWTPDDPALYTVTVSLMSGENLIDEYTVRTGFRTAEFTPKGFFLNGARLKIRGLNRHQAWPYCGYAMPERAQRRDADMLKNEMGVNLVRTSHYPQSPHFLDACDEMGLLVFEEMPGWQHIGDRAWQDNACRDLDAMIRRDRNRPSIILWGVRINESADNHEFYTRTNAIARALDPKRATGGVRAIGGSELLETVYTFNDFTHAGLGGPLGSGPDAVVKQPRKVTGLKKDVPYLITEHNGHMFPTKRFDNEERLTEHALRHARVLDAAWGRPGVAGAIGWCAFDYNTHKDFGSGDRICYHGVSDIYRLPKYAAAVYASQLPPEKKLVMEAASLFAKGERSAIHLLPIEVYTNADSVVLYRGGKRVGEYVPDRKSFPNLEHPPVIIRELIGEQLRGSRFTVKDQAFLSSITGKIFSVGLEALGLCDKIRTLFFLARYRLSFDELSAMTAEYMIGWGRKDEIFELAAVVGGREVRRQTYGGDAHAVRLELQSDDETLTPGGSWDTTRLTIRAIDRHGNLRPFTVAAVKLHVSGPAAIIGPTLVPLTGGVAAFWIRTTGTKGEVTVTAASDRFPMETVKIEIQ